MNLEVDLNSAKTGLQISETITLGQWSDIGHKLIRYGHGFSWMLGDWAAYGDREFGKLKEFADLNHLNYGSLRNMAYVSQRIELSRRHDKLSWAHHSEVASLPELDQVKWLDIAEKENISTAELRRRIRSARPGRDALTPDGPVLRTIGTKFDEVCSFLTTRPVEFWDDERKRIWKERLRPVVEFYGTL